MSLQSVYLIHGKPSAREQRALDALNARLDAAMAVWLAARASARSHAAMPAQLASARADGKAPLSERILAVLADRRPRTTHELMAELPPGTKRGSVSATLTDIRRTGKVSGEPGERVDGSPNHRSSVWRLA